MADCLPLLGTHPGIPGTGYLNKFGREKRFWFSITLTHFNILQYLIKLKIGKIC